MIRFFFQIHKCELSDHQAFSFEADVIFLVIYSFSFFDHQNWDVQEIHPPPRMLGENYRCLSMMTMMSR